MAKAKPAWKFQYIGPGDVATGLQKIERDGKEDDHPGVLIPGDVVVVDDLDTAVWLRSLTNCSRSRKAQQQTSLHITGRLLRRNLPMAEGRNQKEEHPDDKL